MPLSYSDLPVTTGTHCFATYQNYLRSALIERAALVGATIVPPPLINAGDKIKTTFGPWLVAARQAVADILAEGKYGWIPTILATGWINFGPWDLTGDGVNDGNSKNGILHYIHSGLLTSANNKFINDLYTITPGSPIVGINNLFCSENSFFDIFTPGRIGKLKAVGDDHVAFQSAFNSLYGPPVRILNSERRNIFDNPLGTEASSQALNSGIIVAGSFASTTLIDGVYFQLRPDGASPIDMQMTYNLPIAGNCSYVYMYGRYEVTGSITGKNIQVLAWNYTTSAWNVIGVINGQVTNTNNAYQITLTNDYRFMGTCKIRFISTDEEVNSNLYIDYCDVFCDSGTSRFVRVKRTTALPLIGNGNIFATVNTFDEHKWMYYDHGELNALYRSYFRELWFCVELMRYSSLVPPSTTTITSDGKSISSDPKATELLAWTDGVTKFGAAPWGAAPGGLYDSEIHTFFGGATWVSNQYATRCQDISVPNPGATILRIWMPLVMDYYTNPTFLPAFLPGVAWTGGTKVGEFTYFLWPGRKRSYLQLDIAPGLDNHLSKIPSLPTDMPTSLGSNSGVREFFESLAGGGWRDGVQDNIFVYKKSTFFSNPLSPPTIPPP